MTSNPTVPHWPDSYDGEENYADEPDEVKCPRCGGSGLEIEGWDCDYCDGSGYLDV